MDQQDSRASAHSAALGGMAESVRGRDWAGTALGPAQDWCVVFRTVLDVMLGAIQPMFLVWGPDRVLVYNDAYVPLLGVKHPGALGQPFLAVWQEVADTLRPMVAQVFDGIAVHMDDIALTLQRGPYPELAHFAFSYTPVRGVGGEVAGLLCVCTETTAAVEEERRRAVLLLLADQVRGLTAPRAILSATADALCRHLCAPGVAYGIVQPDGRNLLLDTYQAGDTVAARSTTRLDLVGRDVLERLRSGIMVIRGPGMAVASPLGQGVLVPLVQNDALSAVLHVLPGTRRLSAGDLGLLSDVAARVWEAVERAQAERALRDSDAYVRMLLESTAEGFYAVDRDGVTTLCNPAFLQMLGFAQESDAIGRKLHGLIHHSHPGGEPYCTEDCPIYVCARDGTPAHVLGELFYRVDGSPLPVEYWARPILRDGVQVGAICNFLDMTERVRAEQALRQETHTLEILNRTGAMLASELELDQVMHRLVEAGIALTGAQHGAFHPIEMVRGPDALSLDTLRVDGAPFEGLPEPVLRGEGEARIGDVGEDVSAIRSCLSLPVTSRSGDRLGALLFGHDKPQHFLARHETLMRGVVAQASIAIDNARLFQTARRELGERTEAERRLSELNGTLEQRIAVTLADRAAVEEALRQSQKMEAVGQLTGGLAHDFNNLLTGITGSLELLGTRIAQGRIGDLDRYVNAAQGAAKRAASLTHRLLAFSRRQTLEPRPTGVNRLVAGMEDLIRRTVGPAVTIEVVGAAGLWNALVDPNQLENALLNLCINARDAMPDGGRLAIETANKWFDERTGRERDLPAGQYLSLCVTDTGTGMTPEVIARAFDPFFTTKPIGLGTGLGLSMIYGFARQSGGQVRIYSELGMGTTMCLYLPRYLGPEEMEETSNDKTVAPRAEQGETVLVVDDEATIRMLVAEILEDLGYTAIEAVDGAAGLRVLQSDVRIDLLVTDVGLPGGMNGRQVADAGRALRPGLKVLFITGYAENAVLSHGHLDPGMQVLTKPFSMDALAGRIKTMIASE